MAPNHKSLNLLQSILIVSAFWNVPAAHAVTTTCIQAGDTSGLQAALWAAATDGDDNVIRLQAGTYSMAQSFVLDYEATTEHHDLLIEGGYFESPNADPCGLRFAQPDPRITVLDGGLLRLKLSGGATGSLTVQELTVKNAFSMDVTHPPIEIFGGASPESAIVLENMMFVANTSSGTSAIYVFSNQGALRIHNSLFASNTSFAGINAVRLGTLQQSQSFCAEIINSTFADNASLPAEAVGIHAECTEILANDIFWGNVGTDVRFEFPLTTLLTNNDLGNLDVATNTQYVNLLSVNPLFNSDFSLADLSPLRDAGDPGGFLFGVGDYDLVGHPRVVGAKPDIGAYEITDVIFANGFDFQLPF